MSLWTSDQAAPWGFDLHWPAVGITAFNSAFFMKSSFIPFALLILAHRPASVVILLSSVDLQERCNETLC